MAYLLIPESFFVKFIMEMFTLFTPHQLPHVKYFVVNYYQLCFVQGKKGGNIMFYFEVESL